MRMPSTRRKARERHFGKTEQEWEEWGERFGRKWERKGRGWGEEWSATWLYTLGLAGPLIGSIIGIFFLAVGVLLLNLVNLILWSPFITAVAGFLWSNIGIFFAIMLFLGYGKYLSRIHPFAAWFFAPIAGCIGITVFLWIGVFILGVINTHVNSAFISSVVLYVDQNLLGIFLVLLVFFYVFAISGNLLFGSFMRRRHW